MSADPRRSCAHRLIALLCLFAVLLAAPAAAEEIFVQTEKITPSPAGNSTNVGNFRSVDISGDWAVVGGAKVFVLHRNELGEWTYFKELTPTPPSGVVAAGFGTSAAILGDFIAVGAPDETFGLPTAFNAGAVYIFAKSEGGLENWGQRARLTINGAMASGDSFGEEVALGPDRVAVGITQGSNGNPGAGKVQVFGKNGTATNTWGFLAELSPSDGVNGDLFGFSLTFFNTTVVVGSLGWPDKKAYLYDVPTTIGVGDNPDASEVPIVPNSGANSPGTFGQGMVLQGTTLAISAQGSVEIFERNLGGADNWGYDETIVGPNVSFGNALDLYGTTLLVGNLNDTGGRGKASVYKPTVTSRGTTWTFDQDLFADDGLNGDFFSADLAIDFGTAVIGAPLDDNSEGNSAGAAYIFEEFPAIDLSISIDDGTTEVARGDSTTYTIQASNLSGDDVTNATVSSTVLTGTIDSASSSWTCAPDVGSTAATSCPANGTIAQINSGVAVDLGAGESLTFALTLQTETTQPATLETEAVVAPPLGSLDSNASNDSATDVNSFVNRADLSLAVVPSPLAVLPGETFTVQAQLTNAGPSPGTGQVDVDLPPNVTFLGMATATRGASGPPCAPPEDRGAVDFRCSALLESGETAIFDVQLRAELQFLPPQQSTWTALFPSGSDPDKNNNHVAVPIEMAPVIFFDRFESGDTSAWQ